MQFDRTKLIQIGAALLVALLAAVFGLNGGGGSKDAPKEAPQASLNDDATQTSPPDPTVSAYPSTKVPPTVAPSLSPPKTKSAALPVADGDFDYYLLVLAWSPTHCSSSQGGDDDMQCRSGRPYGFIMHGLWPQNERGYPQDCSTDEREVSARNMEIALKLSPSRGLVRHEWQKHGTCAGLSQSDYFATAAQAVASVKVPAAYQALAKPLMTTPDDVRDSFVAANAGLAREALAATCARNELAEVWVCLDKDLTPRACSADVRKRHCGSRRVRMLSVRGDWPR